MYVDLGDSSMDKMTKETHPKKMKKTKLNNNIKLLHLYLCNKKKAKP